MKIIQWLKLPEVRDIDNLDDPAVTLLHGEIIQRKGLLKNTYIDFYKEFLKAVPEPQGKILVELGSGGGFIKEVIGNVTTSDILDLPNVDKVFSAVEMPFDRDSVDAFFMIDVLHHIAHPRAFFREALRCLKAGGKVVMIEPANTPWSRFIYRNFHHEAFDAKSSWELGKGGPVSHGNGALPWIIFRRDRKVFEDEFPCLRIVRIRNHTPLRYLLSGGLTLRQLLPSFTYPVVKAIEYALTPLRDVLGMFQTIEVEKSGR
ncbi:MAG: class I SAM-dependent methyltransferase [Sedimentisphaerales bacterium]|nr:class I SAM-dependent methyltransferase [Sedimentisphaerales bacterium]